MLTSVVVIAVRYKLDHGLKKPNGPGRNELPDWNETRKPPVKLPITGTSTTTILGGQPRSSQRSSDAIGAFWTEPTSQHLKFSGVDRYNVPEIAARPNAGLGRTTSSQIGRFYNQEYVELYGPIDPPTTAHNKNSVSHVCCSTFLTLRAISIRNQRCLGLPHHH